MISPFTDLVDADYVKRCTSNQTTTSFFSIEIFRRKFLDSPKSLKKAARKWCLPVAHPIRQELWPRLINRCCNAKIKIPHGDTGKDNSNSVSHLSFDSSTSKFSSSELTGLELADRRLQNTYHLNQHGRSTLRFLLHELSVSRPDLVYAPQTWAVLALLLHFHPPSLAVACLNAMLNVPGLLIQTKGDWRCSCLALEYLGASGFAGKKSFKHLHQQQADFKRTSLPHPNSANNGGKVGETAAENENMYASSPSAVDAEPRNQLGVWPITVWQLPFEYIVPLVDCFIVEGPKVLFRAGLMLWHLASKEERRRLAQAAKASKGDGRSCDIAASLQSVAATLPPGGEMQFLKTIFGIRRLSTVDVKEAIQKSVANQSCNIGLDLVDSLVVPCILPGQRTYTAFTQVKAELEIKGRSSLRSPTHVPTSMSPLPTSPNLASAEEIAFLISGIKDDLLAASYTPVSIFSTATDGCSLSTLFKAASNHVKATGRPETILLVQTRSGEGLVGAYCTFQWEAYGREQNYYGNGRSFLFRLRPSPAIIYHWDEEAGKDSFQRSALTFLEVGGGVDSSPPGLRLDANLEQGESGFSPTYASQCLITLSEDKVYEATVNEKQFCSFKIGAVELLGFKHTVVN